MKISRWKCLQNRLGKKAYRMAKMAFILINLRFLSQPQKKFLTLLKQSYNSDGHDVKVTKRGF